MSQPSRKEEQFQLFHEINRVEGFDPAAFAVEYTDMNTGEVRKRLPVMIQMAWFRLKYPEGRIAVEVTPAKDCFVAKARVYPSYKDGPECYLAEATASRGPDPAHPSVSPREWAQTAAVGVALRNAGFGLQFSAAGEEIAEKKSPRGTGLPYQRQYPCGCGRRLCGERALSRGKGKAGHASAMPHYKVHRQDFGGRPFYGPQGHKLDRQQVYWERGDFGCRQAHLRICQGAGSCVTGDDPGKEEPWKHSTCRM